MFSYWERETFWKRPDVVILGSGIVGLNAAIHLKTLEPALSVAVVERGFLPYGASTRNAGFACFGSLSELLSDLRTHTHDEVFSLVERRWNGLRKLREMLGDATIDYEPLGGYEIFGTADTPLLHTCLESMHEINEQMRQITGEQDVYLVAHDRVPAFGFRGVSGMILNRLEGQIDTGKMMQSLTDLARDKGIGIFTGVQVEAFAEQNDRIELRTKNGFVLDARFLIVATNGFARDLFPELEVHPARAQVLITHPIKNLPFKGSFHYDEGYYYFRNVGNRILFGGGRNLDFKAEETTEMNLTALVQDKLEALLRTMILPGIPYDVDIRWSGIMGIGRHKSTLLKKLSPRTVCAVRMGGMGVAIGSLVGEDAARLLITECM